jgi:FlaG/FlaF family flagellin (archaellin)
MRIEAFQRADDGAAEVIGVVLMVGITVLLAATATVTLTDFVQDGKMKMPVQAAADVDASDSADRVTVTWVANGWAERLVVTFEVNGDHQTTVRLLQVGDTMRLDADGLTRTGSKHWHHDTPSLSNGDRVTVTVTAERGGQRTVISQEATQV